jgi:hypothetical protein
LWKPYYLIDSGGNAVDIPAGSHQAELWFRDPRNPANDILYLSVATNSGHPWFYHGAIGIAPNPINMYLRFPEGKEIPGRFPNVDPIRPSSGDDLGYINEEISPYDEPTDHAELVIPPGVHVSAEYYNKDPDRDIQPRMNLSFALYWVQFFSPEKNTTIIRRIANREIPASFLTVGFGDVPIELGSKLMEEWKVKPLSLSEASSL